MESEVVYVLEHESGRLPVVARSQSGYGEQFADQRDRRLWQPARVGSPADRSIFPKLPIENVSPLSRAAEQHEERPSGRVFIRKPPLKFAKPLICRLPRALASYCKPEFQRHSHRSPSAA